MAKQKHILILTETRGGKGHIMPARAIEDALHHLYPGKHRVSIVNMGDETKFALEDTLHFLYVYTSKYIPGVLSTYKLSDSAGFMKSINNAFYRLKKKEILELYEKFQPDLVLSNYPVWEYAFFKVLRKHYPGVPFINLNTDSHYPHRAWLIADADYNIVSDEDTKNLYVERGKDPKKIKVLGIPVRHKFVEAAKQLDPVTTNPKPPYKVLYLPTASDAKTILKFIEPFADRSDYQLRVILGRNKTAAELIKSKIKANNITLIGWTDEIPQELSNAHLVISKAGGSTTQESIVLLRPMIINKIVPGQELGNVALIKQHRLGKVCTKPAELIKTCEEILNDYPAYQRRIKELAKPDSAEQIAQLLDSVEA